MDFKRKAIAFAIICFAYATGTHEAVDFFCKKCKMLYGERIVVSAQLLGIIINVIMQ
ncbi:hypothetical protein [uncultured Ruminococcus sp.]|uniref:hypothetical protein n=1 Tax=uncultured Ruminococcus sp. TaxID=165186 RepID=UPI00262FFF99|nr:hypothetical protein [uncultured Ruminococcus sp.]